MTQEVLKLALDALENHEGNYKLGDAGCDRHEAAITAIKEALAQRTWVGLTDKDIDYIYTGIRAVHHDVDSYVFCRAVEAKLKQNNGYSEEKNT